MPVVPTAAGWAFAGGGFTAAGVPAVNRGTAAPPTRERLRAVAIARGSVAVLCFPSGYADRVVLPADYRAGVCAGAYGGIGSPLAFGVVALSWWLVVDEVFGYDKGVDHRAVGWIRIGHAFLLPAWGSTLLRT